MYMFKYIMKRIGLMFLSFVIIMTICFVLIKMLPIVITTGVGQDANLQEEIIKARGYRDPIIQQYFTYIFRIITKGDFGMGITMPECVGKPVWESFVTRLPPTILINVYSTLYAVPIGILLGIYAALRKNKIQDHVISTLVIVFISVPSYVTASVIQYLLCYELKLFPLTMKDGYDYFSWSMFVSMIPCILAMSAGSIAGYARGTRAELTEVLTSEYLLLARTKGLTKRQAIFRHALRNAMVPIFPSIIGEFISVLSGSLILESIFGIPGVGKMYLASIRSLDYDFFMLLSGFYCLIGLVAGIVVDISYGFIDPRIRMGAK